MINALSPMIPPPLPTAEALTSAMTLLQVAADPAGTRARLDELTEQVKVVHSAIAEHTAAQKAAEAEVAKLADLHAREQALDDKQAQADAVRLQNDTAAAALTAREQKLAAAEAAVGRRETDLAAREKGLENRRAELRKALS